MASNSIISNINFHDNLSTNSTCDYKRNTFIMTGVKFHKGFIRTNKFEADSSREQGKCKMVAETAKIWNISDSDANLELKNSLIAICQRNNLPEAKVVIEDIAKLPIKNSDIQGKKISLRGAIK